MGKIDTAIKVIKAFSKTHAPEILTGVGVASMVASTIMAVKATPKAMQVLQQEIDKDPDVDLSTPKKVKATWKCYVPAVITGVAGAAMIFTGCSVNLRRNAAITAACSLAERTAAEFKNAAREVVGEKKVQEIQEKVIDKKMAENPASAATVVLTGDGETWCYESISDRYFKTNISKVHRAEFNLLMNMIPDNYASLNDYYYELGLKNTGLGDELGWNMSQIGEVCPGSTNPVIIRYDSKLTDDGTPCLVIDYRIPPRSGYSHCH